ncbi:hypothetical protein [Streptomyces sp. 8N706]|uniref:hypothetical protein n=1 Tax=Streptomyces sp. 8N706 TaxID=3457416 RepID=UPI003FD6689F
MLLALDFVGGMTEVLSQPFTLQFTTCRRPGRHTPDFLALTRGTALLIDVRPANLIKPDDAVKFAAAQRAAGAAGWQYAVARDGSRSLGRRWKRWPPGAVRCPTPWDCCRSSSS